MKRRWILAGALVLALAALVTRNTILARRGVALSPEAARQARQQRAPHAPLAPELEKGLSAFSSEQYSEARRIAEATLAGPDRGSNYQEALDLLVESWLAEGDFGKARAAAHKYQEKVPTSAKEALGRIAHEESSYLAALHQYQVELASAKGPEQAAEVQLHIGHLYHQVGRLQLALSAYREVVVKYPRTAAAHRAKRQLASLRDRSSRAGATAQG